MAAASLSFAAVNLALGQTWIPVASNQTWTCIASSADGAKIVAGTQFTPIYLSTNSGATWAVTSTPSNLWAAIASSADGRVLVALAQQWRDGLIYRSTNSGANWIPTSAPGTPQQLWSSVACSADGRTVVAATESSGIYLSLDSGATWAVTSAPDANYWTSVACSADGTKFAASSWNYAIPPWFIVPGAIYFSSDSGTNWTEASGTWGMMWESIACSADGRKMTAANGVNVFFSEDSGTTWTNTGVCGSSVASSADGTSLATAVYSGLIYFSKDSGADWTATSAGSNYWFKNICSSDGNAWLALDLNGIIWRSQATPKPLLGLTPRSSSLVLSWPVPSMSLVLQQNSDLSTTNWVNMTGTPVLNLTNLQNEVTLFPTDRSGFYRLATP
jgi:photosystem II stability/assembly factor-like uncharacterized protein